MGIHKKISIIIVSYNTCQMTLACLKSLFKKTELCDFEVIVLDNNSIDGSAEAIENSYPELTLIKSKVNLGFSEGNNYCAKVATGDLLLLLNPDTLVLDNAIDKLVDFSNQYPSSGIWGGKTLFADHSLNPSSCWGEITAWSLFCRASGLAVLFSNNIFFNSEGLGGWKRDSIKQVDIVSGCFFLISKALWDQLGGFDSRFFMYGEEADLCLRAHKLGYQPIVTNKAEIIHYGGASEKKRADKLVKLLTAKAQLIRNHWSPLTIDFGVFLLMLWPLSRYVAYKMYCLLVKSKKNDESYEVWEAVWQSRSVWLKGYY